jgi:hypothetical protein
VAVFGMVPAARRGCLARGKPAPIFRDGVIFVAFAGGI